MATALISLGSNAGDRAATIGRAIDELGKISGLRIAAVSSLHQTRPAGGPAGQQPFLNAAALLETSLPPRELLSVLLKIEDDLGRIRAARWGPRTIDLDLLLYDQLELETPELILPHPRMSFRRFVLEPAAEIAAGMVHPVCGNTIGGLLRHLDSSPRWIAVSASPRLRDAICQAAPEEWLVTDWPAAQEKSDVPRLLIVSPGPYRHDEYRGPVLCLGECSQEQLRAEVLAAIAAME